MPRVKLKGLSSATKRLASGEVRRYWYAWRGGPPLPGRPGSAEFTAAYNAAIAQRKTPIGDDLAGLVKLYRAAPEFARNAESTRAEWTRWLDRIGETEAEKGSALAIGDLSPKMLDDRRVRKELLAWRDQWAATPRQADYAMQVLSRVLSWAVDRGHLALNAAAGTEQLYRGGRADRIWLPHEIEAYAKGAGSPEVGFILPLALATGLRREDLCTLADSHIGRFSIAKPTGKSRGRKIVRVPILAASRELIAEIRAQRERRWAQLAAVATKKGRPEPVRATTLLTNTRGRPWTPDGLETQVIKAKAAIESADGDAPHLHDARGNFITRLRVAGRLKASEIADIVGWDEDRVERLLAIYVDNDATIQALAERIDQNEKRP